MSTGDDFFRITDPCPLALADLRGGGPTRHCAQCDRQVHDLSALTRRQAARLRRRFLRRGERLCGIMVYTPGGQAQFQPSLRQRLRASLRSAPALALLLSPGGCPSTAPPPAPPPEPPLEASAEPLQHEIDEEMLRSLRYIGGYIE